MKTINGITYLEPGEKHPNADKSKMKRRGKRSLENRTTIRSGFYTKSQLKKKVKKDYY